MSFLSDVLTFWTNSPTLSSALPVGSAPLGKCWVGVVADGVQLPFAVLNEVVSKFVPTTGQWYYDNSTLQISLFSNTLTNALSLADTVTSQFDRAVIATGYMQAIRQDKKTIADPSGAYHVVVEYLVPHNAETAS